MTPADVVDMKIRVLLVDDEPLLMRAITRILGQRFDLHCVPNGADGLKSMRESAYAVVVSDMRMPGMDGAEFLKQARVVSPDGSRFLSQGAKRARGAVVPSRPALTSVSEGLSGTPGSYGRACGPPALDAMPARSSNRR